MQKLTKFTKLGNRAFSLVELIIVIAIMAILIAVLAPMYIRYVERSRQSTDASAVGSMLSTLEAVSIDTSIDENPSGAYTLIWHCGDGGNGRIEVRDSAGPLPLHEAAVHGIVGDVHMAKSSAARTPGATITITIDVDLVTRLLVSPAINPGVGQNQHFLDLLASVNT